ncbi:hypothetical protein WA026_013396 [Henosepilachna vigintioctopunctata]|uniref:HAT C-terminal dimerisation domain-containing protein n=1 Tax=Henosepilachna vigintioctopunctata TaxID=420089 RepID=A0AAW1V5V4_9CUCU
MSRIPRFPSFCSHKSVPHQNMNDETPLLPQSLRRSVSSSVCVCTAARESLFDEVSYLANYVNNDVLKRWEENKSSTEQRWKEVFRHFKDSGIPFQNCLAIVQYLLCLPGTNAPTERVFSLMNSLWTSEKSSLKVETLRAMLIIKFNMGSCENFLDILIQNPDLSKKCTHVKNMILKINVNSVVVLFVSNLSTPLTIPTNPKSYCG